MQIISRALAQTTYPTDVGEVNGITQYVSNILAWAVPILGGVAIIMTIYAGYLYMTSQGNADSISKAKDIMIGVIAGIILLFCIRILLNQVGVR